MKGVMVDEEEGSLELKCFRDACFRPLSTYLWTGIESRVRGLASVRSMVVGFGNLHQLKVLMELIVFRKKFHSSN